MTAMSDFQAAMSSFSAACTAAMTRKGQTGVPNGVLPISRFGALGATGINYSTNVALRQITINAGNPLFMAGQTFSSLAAQTLGYFAGATTYFYVQLQNGTPTYVASATPIAESNTNMFIGQMVADGAGNVTSITLVPVTRIDTFRPSTTQRGSSIPVSGATPDQASGLLWT
jgi:hypothetical protein